jgi:hypothetical protein
MIPIIPSKKGFSNFLHRFLKRQETLMAEVIYIYNILNRNDGDDRNGRNKSTTYPSPLK